MAGLMQKLDMRQWVNHFPGSYGLGRKDYLWRNISRMARQHSNAYDFCAKTYVLPRDRAGGRRFYGNEAAGGDRVNNAEQVRLVLL